MSATPTPPRPKPPLNDETRRIIQQRLAAADKNPKQDYIEALADVIREGRDETS